MPLGKHIVILVKCWIENFVDIRQIKILIDKTEVIAVDKRTN